MNVWTEKTYVSHLITLQAETDFKDFKDIQIQVLKTGTQICVTHRLHIFARETSFVATGICQRILHLITCPN